MAAGLAAGAGAGGTTVADEDGGPLAGHLFYEAEGGEIVADVARDFGVDVAEVVALNQVEYPGLKASSRLLKYSGLRMPQIDDMTRFDVNTTPVPESQKIRKCGGKQRRGKGKGKLINGKQFLAVLEFARARFRMANGVMATFDSIANDDTSNIGFGLQLIGSRGIIAIRADRDPLAHLITGNPFMAPKNPREWQPITTMGIGRKEDQPQLIKEIHEHVVAVRDLVAAVDEGREPVCGLEEGAGTVEMICAVFESHRQGGRAVAFPLGERGHPLSRMKKEGRK